MNDQRPLGRIPPSDDRHLVKYPLTASTMPAVPTPVAIGINWYKSFDAPFVNTSGAWIGGGTSWGAIRGGHAVCLKPPAVVDTLDWWSFYDQKAEGACVGFAVSRYATLMNRRRYAALPLYRQAQKTDEWPGENYVGTSLRAGLNVAKDSGLWRWTRGVAEATPTHDDGIHVYRWAMSIEDLAACLDPPNGTRVLSAGYVTMLNSWGRRFPHYVRIPLEALYRLIYQEDGDAAIATDK